MNDKNLQKFGRDHGQIDRPDIQNLPQNVLVEKYIALEKASETTINRYKGNLRLIKKLSDSFLNAKDSITSPVKNAASKAWDVVARPLDWALYAAGGPITNYIHRSVDKNHHADDWDMNPTDGAQVFFSYFLSTLLAGAAHGGYYTYNNWADWSKEWHKGDAIESFVNDTIKQKNNDILFSIPCKANQNNTELVGITICDPYRRAAFDYQHPEFADVKGTIEAKMIDRIMHVKQNTLVDENGEAKSNFSVQWLMNIESEHSFYSEKNNFSDITEEDLLKTQERDSICNVSSSGTFCPAHWDHLTNWQQIDSPKPN